VVTLLETLRALQAGPALRNDVIVVFADAEENGDVGAAGFMGTHPWARDVRLALNFEGYATGGPSFLFATSRQNGWLIDQFLAVAPQPTGSSLFVALMGLEPGSGMDLEEYMARGAAGLDFTYVNYATTAYHTAGDTVAAVDPRGIQHDGNYALALVRHFGDIDLSALPRTPDAVFFNVLPGVVAHYPQPWATPLAAAVAALLIGLLVVGFRRRRLTIGGLVVGTLAFLLGTIGTFALATLTWMGIKALNPNYQVVLVGTYQGALFLAAFAALAFGIMAALYVWLRARVRLANLTAGALLIWMVLMGLTAARAPGASYLFTWPLLFALLGLGWLLIGDNQAAHPWRSVAVLFLAAAPGVILVTLAATNPLFPMMNRLEMMTQLPLSVAPALLVTLLAGLLVPQFALLAGEADRTASPAWRRWLVPGTAVLIGLALIGVANVRSGFDAQHPRPNSIAYQLDADTGQALWLSADPAPDAWTRQFFPDPAVIRRGERFPTLGLPAFAAAAPVVVLPAPAVAVLGDSTDGTLRTLNLQLISPRHAQNLAAEIQAEGEIVAATLNGQALDFSAFTPEQRRQLVFTYVNPPEQGIELTLRIASTGPLALRLQDSSAGLPHIPGMTIAARPPEMMPISGPTLLDPTVVRSSVTVPAR
jgi:MFS family permease